tara:strand:+ start:4253 stop:5452 length:1200 start_codon:yes stop_codon:yes gene_type:complete
MLTDTFQQELNLFLEKAADDGLTVSGKPNKNFRYIGELLRSYKVEQFFVKRLNTHGTSHTMADLLKESPSLDKTITLLDKKIEHAKGAYTESEATNIDGLIMLRDCFQLVKTALNRKHSNQYSDDPLFICALCWRRVRVSDNLRNEGRRDSTFYCEQHLPNKSEHYYRKDRTALLSAMKSTQNRYLEELKYYENLSFKQSHSLAPTIFKWVSSFTKRPSSLFSCINIHESQDCKWADKANILTNQTQTVFPLSYQKLKDINANEFASAAHWLIDGIVSSLDESKSKDEVLFWWREEPNRIRSPILPGSLKVKASELDNNNSDEYLLLMCSIIARYEAVQTINNIPQPRGGGAKKDKKKRDTVAKLLAENLKLTGKKNISGIADAMGISTSRVYKILKDL